MVKYLLIGLLILGIASGGYYLGRAYSNPTPINNLITQPNTFTKPSPSPKTTIDEEKIIMTTVNAAFPNGKIQGIESTIKFNKQLGDYARLTATATKETLDPLTIIVQKKTGKWTIINFGTSFPELEGKLPELFID